MTEKKTFKNEPVDTEKSFEDGYVVWFTSHDRFDSQDWDMEVTFTKKVKPPKVGGKAQSPSGWDMCEIAAIDGDEVWLRFDDGSHCTIALDKLIYAS